MAKKPDWSKIEDVFAFLEKKNGRALSDGEKELILGQRQINRRFYEAISAILENASPSKQFDKRSNAQSLAAIKKDFQSVPGERPPGCASDADPKV
ncbi:MAG TPA: hypothetical protein VN920_08470 [Pyrinomonadaceae bacterium]|nr:hypothetical protein [Pyrinomonadaceae bacterium]